MLGYTLGLAVRPNFLTSPHQFLLIVLPPSPLTVSCETSVGYYELKPMFSDLEVLSKRTFLMMLSNVCFLANVHMDISFIITSFLLERNAGISSSLYLNSKDKQQRLIVGSLLFKYLLL